MRSVTLAASTSPSDRRGLEARAAFRQAGFAVRDERDMRGIPAASRSMAVIVEALGAVAAGSGSPADLPGDASPLRASVAVWAERSGLADVDVEVLALALLTWTRLHGIISLEIGGHLLLLRPSLLQAVAADLVEVTGCAGRFALDAVTTWIGQEIDGCQRSAGTSNSEDRFGAAALVTLSGLEA
ncbi:TetR-like C-terminal domain-containing protein [Curtobacterium sp. MCBD17_030]|uniref:TetR-like C-terminal domain-containing protein n=1 Tax=Curtobacterium sp. MCBD17_030 TaxID=2175649 RepID=UPI0011B64AAC|nr:TetR-like C-terminal domain-containing protein [Curtobacterium sp. MCBD17_030]